MIPPRLEVAEVIRSYRNDFLEEYGSRLTPDQRRALNDLADCRTAALGGHVLGCLRCGHQQVAYNSCGNRHCPKCQATAAARWLEARAAELLPVPYFHVVFTLPNAFDPLALANPRVVYNLLLRCAAETLLAVAANPRHLGARIGVLALLHTWGQDLHLHPHVHCVVPGGGLGAEEDRWIACPKNFFLPVRILGAVFRGKFLGALRAAFAQGKLRLPGRSRAAARRAFERLVATAVAKDWVVYAKAPFGGPEQVLKYLARYTHRAAISNERLLAFKQGKVTFSAKDYAQGGRRKTVTLEAVEFLRRFLMHVLPASFVRIRHYGLLSNRCREKSLALCRQLIARGAPKESDLPVNVQEARISPAVTPTRVCPVCGAGHMVVIEVIPPSSLTILDSS
jgi:hypothetical protein